MQELGNFLSRLGPLWGALLLVFGFAVALALLAISIPTLVRPLLHRHRHA
jgi:hypothetical protein